MGNDWLHEYFINELKAIGRKPTSNMQHEVVDSLPSSGNEQTIYFVKNDSSSSNNHYDEYVWISSSSTFEKIGSSQIDNFIPNPSTAKIGQTIVVKDVDENGKPTKWEAVDFPESMNDLNALEALAGCDIIIPAYQDGTFYTDVNSAIYVL